MSEATSLPTEPQPLPTDSLFALNSILHLLNRALRNYERYVHPTHLMFQSMHTALRMLHYVSGESGISVVNE